MRKNLFLFLTAASLLTLASVQTANAQNGTPYWSTFGNSNATSSSKLGTTNGINLRLFTNNAERVRILYTNGFVGINTTAPNARLHFNTAAGTSLLRGTVDGLTKLYMSSAGGLTVGAGLAAPANGLYVAGNVGIGTATPSYKLHVVSSGVAVYGQGATGVYGNTTTSSGDAVAASTNATGAAWGVNTYSQNSIGIVAATGNSSTYAGYFQGNVYTTGSYLPSARKLKQNITELSSALDLIAKLHPKEYEYKHDGTYKLMNLPEGKRYGLIAEKVEEVLPGLVKATEFIQKHHTGEAIAISEKVEFKALNYTELIPIIVKGMQEQAELIKQQQLQIDDLKAQVSRITGGGSTLTGMGSLGQNTPNPVRTSTRIAYSVPSGVNHAQLLLTDNGGKTIKAVSLSPGSNAINLNTMGLSSGIYNYSLMIDGTIVETKKMEVVRNQ